MLPKEWSRIFYFHVFIYLFIYLFLCYLPWLLGKGSPIFLAVILQKLVKYTLNNTFYVILNTEILL